MREILFRGKRVDNGEWVYGYYVRLFSGKKNQYSYRIYTGPAEVDCGDYYPDFFEVDPETVGQYTGLTDKNGRKIFEGDIVDCLEFYGEVYYDPEGCFDLRDNTPEMCGGFIGDYNSLEVVGNIHDNPELLEVTE